MFIFIFFLFFLFFLLSFLLILSFIHSSSPLQEHVRHSLEVLRGAGIRVWMLTGDKVETAACIARSSSLVPPSHDFVEISESKFTAWSAEKEGQLKKRGSNIFDRHETDENERLTALSVDEKRVFFAKSTLEYFGEHISNSALLIGIYLFICSFVRLLTFFLSFIIFFIRWELFTNLPRRASK